MPNGPLVPQGPCFWLILVTHDESIFYENDHQKSKWINADETHKPECKGKGQLIMVSDFLTIEWGCLQVEYEYLSQFSYFYNDTILTEYWCSEARHFFKPGKNWDGFFTSENLLQQVELAIDIFERKTNGMVTGLFLFDNAPNHQKWAADALSARKMTKGPKAWSEERDGPHMRNGTLPDGSPQHLYYSMEHPIMPGWFKGMERLIQELLRDRRFFLFLFSSTFPFLLHLHLQGPFATHSSM